MESFFINTALLFYGIATITYGFYLFFKLEKAYYPALVALTVGALANLITLVFRGVVAGRVPFSNMYESILLLAAAFAVSQIFFELFYKIRKIGFFSSMMLLIIIAYATFFADDRIMPLVPALQSNWLTIHVITYFIGYGALCISFITAIITVTRPNQEWISKDVTYKVISFAFPFLTLGLITGAVWAKQAWGDYWGWDPKETWSLITWFVYLNYLHLPHTLRGALKRIDGKKTHETTIMSIVAIIGFVAIFFTYFGVNYLLAGLHSYTK